MSTSGENSAEKPSRIHPVTILVFLTLFITLFIVLVFYWLPDNRLRIQYGYILKMPMNDGLAEVLENRNDPRFIQYLNILVNSNNSAEKVFGNFALFIIRDEPEKHLETLLSMLEMGLDSEDYWASTWLLQFYLKSRWEPEYGRGETREILERGIVADPDWLTVARDSDEQYVHILVDHYNKLPANKEQMRSDLLSSLVFFVNEPEVLPVVLSAVNEDNPIIRISAYTVLSTLSPDAEVINTDGLLDSIILGLNDPLPFVRLEACRALRAFKGNEAAENALINVYNDPDALVRAEAIMVTREIIDDNDVVLSLLTRALTDPDETVRANAADTLRRIRSEMNVNW